MAKTAFESLDALASRLPFHIDDMESANAAFKRWLESGSESDHRVVQLWTYCFIRRYYLVKFLQDSSYGASDFDELIAKTFKKAERASNEISRPTRYASWVSVVCKNTYLNYLRSRKPTFSIDEEGVPPLIAETPGVYDDVGLAREAILRAIDRLPDYLQECVRLRFIEGLSYAEIGERTGHPLPRIRSYINKAMAKFRSDDELLTYLRKDG